MQLRIRALDTHGGIDVGGEYPRFDGIVFAIGFIIESGLFLRAIGTEEEMFRAGPHESGSVPDAFVD